MKIRLTEHQFKTLYHGTTSEVAREIEKNGFDVQKSADGTIWFTSNKDKILSGEVGASHHGSIIERLIDESSLKLGGWDEQDRYSTDELINMGYDGLKLEEDGEVTYQIFYPEKLNKIIENTSQETPLEIDELQTVTKDRVGNGMFHNVFPSQHNPNIVYKVGVWEDVEEWVDIFKSNPRIFPKVYHVGQTIFKGKLYSYVVVEKLNAERSRNEWNQFNQFFSEFDIDFQHVINDTSTPDEMEQFPDAILQMKHIDPNLYQLLNHYLKLIDMVKYEKEYDMNDFHSGQFGYAKNGVLKCLDI